MKKYELWLDESGEFENDKERRKNFQLSHLLKCYLKRKVFKKSDSEKLIGQKNIHSNEEEKRKF